MEGQGAFVSHTTFSEVTLQQRHRLSQASRCNFCICMTSKSTPPKRVPSRRAFLQSIGGAVPLALLLPALSEESEASSPTATSESKVQDIDPAYNEPEITDSVYLDCTLDGGAAERVTIGLYGGVVPSTVGNFKSLARSGYVGTSVYRVVPGLTVQLGDVLNNGGKSGRAATEDGTLELENVRVKHSIPGLVSMANGRDGRVDSRFFVNTRPGDSGYLDGRYCAFGRVTDNVEFWYRVERAAGKGAFASRLPKVRIIGAGVLP